MSGKKRLGRPLEYPVKILELWLDCIEHMPDVNKDSKLPRFILSNKLKKSELYDKGTHENSLKPVHEGFEKGIEEGIFVENNSLWGLSSPVISILETEKFEDDRKLARSNAIKILVKKIKDGTWKEYYNTTYHLPIEVPGPLKQYVFKFKETETLAWFRANGIEIQEYKKNWYPTMSINRLKVQIDSAWRECNGVVLFAAPARGKTTSVSILLQMWDEESEDNICWLVSSRQWQRMHEHFVELLHEYKEKNPDYRFKLVIENIHHIGGEVEKIEEILGKCDNVQVLMTSRINKETQKSIEKRESAGIVEVVEFPKSYSEELIWQILEYFKENTKSNKTRIKSLISEKQHKNILYAFTEIGRRFNLREFIISWPEKAQDFISKSRRESEILNTDSWHWIFLFLSVFRRYEIEISKEDFNNSCRIFDQKLGVGELGTIRDYLLDEGYLLETYSYDSKLYEMVFHPVIAEEIMNFLIKDEDYMYGDEDRSLQILSKYLEGKEIREFETVKEKLDVEFYGLEIGLFDLLISSKDDEDLYNYRYRFRVYSLLNGHPSYPNLMERLFGRKDVEFFLNILGLEHPKEDMDKMKLHVINHFDPKLASIDCQRFLEKLDLWKEEIDDDGGMYKVESGAQQLKVLFEKRAGFIDECQEYIQSLFSNDKIERFVEFISRLPLQELSNLDLKNISPLFAMSLYIEKNQTVQTHLGIYDYINFFRELNERWNGPTYEKITQTLFKSLVLSIHNFDEKLTLYDYEREVALTETKYELNEYFVGGITNTLGFTEWQSGYRFLNPSKAILQKIRDFHNNDLVQRLTLIFQYFNDYYWSIVNHNNCQELIKEKIHTLFYSEETDSLVEDRNFLSPSYMDTAIQILIDLGFKVVPNNISFLEISKKHFPYFLFVEDFSGLEEEIKSNLFHNWFGLKRDFRRLPLDEIDLYDGKEKLHQQLAKMDAVISRVYSGITPESFVKTLESDSEIDCQVLETALEALFESVDDSSLDFHFFSDLENGIMKYFERRKRNGKYDEKQCLETIWSYSLKCNLSDSEKQKTYRHYLTKFETIRNSPLRQAIIHYENFDLELFFILLLEVKESIDDLIYYLDRSYYFLNRLSFPKNIFQKLMQLLVKFKPNHLTEKFVSLFMLVVKHGKETGVIGQRELEIFRMPFYSDIYSKLHKKSDFLNFLATSVLTERSVLKLAGRIGSDSISSYLLDRWNIVKKGASKQEGYYRIHIDEKSDSFFKIIFNNEAIGRMVIERIFSNVDFNIYKKDDRYKILLALDELSQRYKATKDYVFQLHSDLIQDRDPFFIIDPGTIINSSLTIGFFEYRENERIFDFFNEETRIRNKIKDEFESIFLNIYERERWSSDFDFLFNFIIRVWRSLKSFSEGLHDWSEVSKEMFYDILCRKSKYSEDIKRIFEKSLRFRQERKLLLKMMIISDIPSFFTFLDRYQDNEEELKEILEETKPEDWIWSSPQGNKEQWSDYFSAFHDNELYQEPTKYSYLSYLLRLLKLRNIFPYDISLSIRRMIKEMDGESIYGALKYQNELRDQFQKSLLDQISRLSLFHLMKLIVHSDLEEFVNDFSEELTERLAKSELNRSTFLLCLNYISYCCDLLENSVEQQETQGVVKLREILREYLSNKERHELSEILINLQSIKIIILVAYYLSQPYYLSLLNLDKSALEEIVDFIVQESELQKRLLPSLPDRQWISGKKEFLSSLRHYTSPSKLFFYVESHLEPCLIMLLKTSKSYMHLIKLLSQEYVLSRLEKKEFETNVKYVFSHQILRQLKMYRDNSRYEVCNTVTCLSEIVVKSNTSLSQEELKHVLKDVHKDYLDLLVLLYHNSTSWPALKALKILDEIFGQKIQMDFIEKYSALLEMERYGYDRSLPYLPQSSSESQDQIQQLMFIKTELPIIYKEILENTIYDDFVWLIEQPKPKNYYEEFWFFCREDAWIEQTKEFVSTELKKLLEAAENNEISEGKWIDDELKQEMRSSPRIFELALMCMYLYDERNVLAKWVKQVLEEEDESSIVATTGRGLTRIKISELMTKEKEEMHNMSEELCRLNRLPIEEIKLFYEHNDKVKRLKSDIKQSKNRYERLKMEAEEKKARAGHKKEAYEYLKKWLRERGH